MRWRVKMNDDGIHRVEIPEVPVEAIREAVINSFAHARYDIKIYALCGAKHVNVPYVNEETAFTMEFSRQDRNFWMHWEMKNSLLQN